MRPVFVADLAAATALGDTLAATWARLCAGAGAIAPVARFPTERLAFQQAACLEGLTAEPNENLVCNLLERCLAGLRLVPRETFVIWAGVKGNAQHIEESLAGGAATPCHRPEHYRRWACERLGTAGGGLAINAACASSAVGLALGARMIGAGAARSVLVCAGETVSYFTHTGFGALRALSSTACRPFDAQRDGLCLGDGAGAILLTDESLLEEYRYAPLARLAGWGLANDATHITAPARDGCGLVDAISKALSGARRQADEVQAFCAHGTGTVYNDAMELTALERVFGSRRFPVFSVKGALGHTLGAAGAIEAALCLRALADKVIPPTTGLREPETRAQGRVSATSQPFAGDTILTTNSGFGGVNAALLFERMDTWERKGGAA